MSHPERLKKLEGLASELLAGIRAMIREAEQDAPTFDDSDPPENGKQLFAWARDADVLKQVDAYGRSLHLPRRIVDWPDDNARQCYHAVKAIIARQHA